MKHLFICMIFVVLFLSHSGCGQKPLYLQENRSTEERVEHLLSLLTLEEKIALLHGNSKFTVGGIERLSLPVWSMSDGPHGVREEVKPHVWEAAGWTTDSASYFPTGTALAATWNTELAYEFGQALGREARARNKDVILGPGINVLRTPLCGRNFEYMGEDPYLISEMIVPYITGVQEQGVAACVKHYALNNQEYERFLVDVTISERALREIYLPGYEAAIRKAGALTVMAAYNKVRGDYCSENHYLLQDILKDEWGFEGTVISDWNGTHSTVKSALAGLDVEMGTDKQNYEDWFFAKPLLEAVRNGQIEQKIIDEKARRVLTVMFKTKMFDQNRPQGAFTTPEHFNLARRVAEEAIVLLKNDHQFLPLDRSKIKSIAVIGDNASRKHAHEGGSSAIKALYEVSPWEGLQNKVAKEIKLTFAQGYKRTSQFSWSQGIIDTFDAKNAEMMRREAVLAAKNSDLAILFGGLNHDFDCEGWDRKDMKLPYEQDKLIEEVFNANPKTVLVLISGSPLEMPWVNKIPAIVQAWYNGMEGGNALAGLLFGDVNPSGKLSFTFPEKLSDSPAHRTGNYPGINQEVNYAEGIMVGYRHFDHNVIQPLFAFGHGLSYTDFEYSDLIVKKATIENELLTEVSFMIRNIGDRAGSEVVQLYVGDVESSVERPLKELKAFKKINLNPGEEEKVTFKLDQQAFSFYDLETASWKLEAGLFQILLGSSSRDLRLTGQIELMP